MTANKRTFEVDRFLTRELFLRNPDNTPPAANLSLVTDGKGGVYYRSLTGSTNAAGFNRINLLDTGAVINADLSFNVLNFRQGVGTRIAKQDTNTILIQTTAIIPSSFYAVSTPSGMIYADSVSSVLKITPYYGVNVNISSNYFDIYGNPAFQIINVSTMDGSTTRIIANSTPISSFNLAPGFATGFEVTSTNTIIVKSLFSTYALNTITLPNNSSLKFESTYNQIRLSTIGNIGIYYVPDSTIVFSSYTFNSLVTPAGTVDAENTPAIQISSGYGLTYSQNNNVVQINTSLPSSFNFISTKTGTVSTPFSTNILTIDSENIDVVVTGAQKIKFSIAPTYITSLRINNASTFTDSTNTINISTINDGLLVSSSATGNTVYLGTRDFNEILVNNTTSLYSLNNRQFKLNAAPGMELTTNTLDNSITFRAVSTQGIAAVGSAYSFVRIYSTATTIGQEVSSFTNTTLSAAPESTATLNLAGVLPIKITPNINSTRNLVYVGIDESTLFIPIYNTLNDLASTLNDLGNKVLNSTFSVNTISTLNIDTKELTVSSILVNGENIIGTNIDGDSFLQVTILDITNISAEQVDTTNLTVATISVPEELPLITFDYDNERVGILTGDEPIQATLDVRGLILATAFATFSDPSLKKFIAPFSVTNSDISTIHPWRFNWIADGRSDIGVSATEIEKLFPELVNTTSSGLKTVEYSKLSVVALAAVKNLSDRLEATESTLAGIRVQADHIQLQSND